MRRSRLKLRIARQLQYIVTEPFKKFMQANSLGGNLLLVALVIGMVWANSSFSEQYHALWEESYLGVFLDGFILQKSLHHWLNDGLMAIFFFLIGLEIKRELLVGELSVWRKALFPVAAAAGGMIMPAVFFTALQGGSPETLRGWAIPTATDIAFALGVLSLLGKRVPVTMKIFLTALAIVDDIGAILLIGLFYSPAPVWEWLGTGAGIFVFMLYLNRSGVRNVSSYLGLAVLLWGAILFSGVHATLAGVLAAFAIPVQTRISRAKAAEKGDALTRKLQTLSSSEKNVLADPVYHDVLAQIAKLYQDAGTPLQRLEHALHPTVAYGILPLFALANGGVTIQAELLGSVAEPLSVGIIVGLSLGKPLGIVSVCWLLEKLGVAERPSGMSWRQMWSAGCFAGIGFTMAIFIANLAFVEVRFLESAKLAILLASLASTFLGVALLLGGSHASKNETLLDKKM
ncbi:Na+/H+ antiporter NhaA [Anaeromusa acidaminophila]|uniref:Na+/H+ antiporter NhaA n=1 Tax=Anaeromusa acidaminophila TaxID=81464 RepID=UPI00036D1AB3|nr:Na+/H+ antiporter NhaA [Anaeromusa acidaminophila]